MKTNWKSNNFYIETIKKQQKLKNFYINQTLIKNLIILTF